MNRVLRLLPSLRGRLRRALAVAAAVTAAAGVLVPLVEAEPVSAVDGVILRTITADAGACSVGTGVAFDGSRLLVSCDYDNVIDAVSPVDGHWLASYTIAGVPAFGAMAWDRSRQELWACGGFGGNTSSLYLVNLATGTATYMFDTAGCVDGLAYDAKDDTIWSSPDVATTVSHYSVSGALIGSFAVGSKLGGCNNSGIAVGGDYLLLANNGCSQIYALPKDGSTSTLFGSYTARLEDLECDDVTFAAQGKVVIWSKDAYDNVLNAFEIDLTNCGGVRLPGAQTWGSGSGQYSDNQSNVRSDPVNTATGNFMQQAVDVGFPGAGPSLSFTRFYNSADPTTGPLGQGWTHSFNISLTLVGNQATLRTEDGQQLVYSRNADGTFSGPPTAVATLAATASGYEVTRADHRRLEFDGTGRFLSMVDTRGNALTLAYANGRVSQVADTVGRTLSLTYDGAGMLTQVAASDGRSASFAYTGGLLTSATDVRGKTTQYQYTGGRMTKVVDPTGKARITNVYGADGRVVEQRDSLGHVSTLSWDPGTGTSTFTDSSGAQHIDVYAGNVLVSVQEPGQPPTSTTLDDNGKIIRWIDPNGQTWRFDYDAHGDMVTRTRPDGLAEHFTYDSAHRVLIQTDAANHTTTYVYDSAGNVASTTDPLNHTWSYTYDGAGRQLTATDPENRVETRTYDGAGNLATVTDPAGAKTTYGYDAAGRATSILDPRTPNGGPGAIVRQFTYDNAGNTLTATDGAGHTAYRTYDDAGRLASETDFAGAVTSYAYDDDGQLLSETDANLHTTSYVYDSTGNLTEVHDPAGGVTRYGYDGQRRRTSITDPLGHRTALEYDGWGNVTRRTSPTGAVTTYQFDALGRRVKRTDPNGNVAGANPDDFTWTYGYDAAGHQTSERSPLGAVHQWQYDAAGRLASETDADGRVTTYEYDRSGLQTGVLEPGGVHTTTAYDGDGRPLVQTDGGGRQTIRAYDAAGNAVSVHNPGQAPWTYTYDAMGRAVAVVEPRGNVAGANPADYRWTIERDAAGRTTAVQDPLGNRELTAYGPTGLRTSYTKAGNTTRLEYDAANRLTAVVAPDNTRTAYEYDLVGERTALVDANGHRTAYGYDAAGRLVSETKPGGGVTTYGYDASGNRVRVTDANGNATATAGDGTTTYTFDHDNRRTGIAYSDEATVSFGMLQGLVDLTYGQNTPDVTLSYDPVGNLTSMADGQGVETYTYDARDRLTTVQRGSRQTFAYAFDGGDRLTSRTLSDGTTSTMTYDAGGRLATVTAAGGTTTYGYDPVGNQTTMALPNGQTETRTYDAAGRLTRMRTAKGASILDDRQYTLRADGKATRLDTPGGVETYGYDALGRLTGVCFAASCTGPLAPAIAYQYDAVGNRTSVQQSTGTTTLTYDADDRLTNASSPTGSTAYSYDADGQVVKAGSRQFGYDAAHRLAAVVDGSTVRSFAYDGSGQRAEASTRVLGLQSVDTTRYSWDRLLPFPDVAVERNGSDQVQRTYTYGNDLLSMHSGNADHYFHADRTGSVDEITSSTGSAEWQYSYDPFGNARSAVQLAGTAPANTRRYAGEDLDPAAGVYDLRARDYDTATGRFLSTDPQPRTRTKPYESAYAYTDDDPVNAVDPSGLSPNPFAGANLPPNVMAAASQGGLWKTPAHDAVQVDLWRRCAATCVMEFPVAGGSLNGNTGFVDVFNTAPRLDSSGDLVNDTWEVKPFTDYGLSTGPIQLNSYVDALRAEGWPATWGHVVAPSFVAVPGWNTPVFAFSGLMAWRGIRFYVTREEFNLPDIRVPVLEWVTESALAAAKDAWGGALDGWKWNDGGSIWDTITGWLGDHLGWIAAGAGITALAIGGVVCFGSGVCEAAAAAAAGGGAIAAAAGA